MHSPPTTPRHHWIAEICRRLGRAIDCPLEYVPAGGQRRDEPPAPWQTPIHDGQAVTGLLRLDPSQQSRSPAHLRVVHELGDLVADLLSQVTQADRNLESRSRDVGALFEMGQHLQQPDLRASLESLLRAAAQLTRTWTTAFLMLDASAGELRLRAAWQLSAREFPRPRRSLESGAPDWRAFRDGMVLLQRSNAADLPWLPDNVESGLAIPVELQSVPVGTLWCFERRRRLLGAAEQAPLARVAEQLAALLDRMLLLKERTARRRLSTELRQAGLEHHGGIHAGLRSDRRLDLAVRSQTAGDLGGDLCELFLRSDDEALIAVGDAVGHSIPAALIMSLARGAIHGLLPDLDSRLSLSQLLGRINAALYRVTRAEQFMTLVCATLNLETLTLQYANAGHPSPFLLRDGQAQALESHGLLLGILPETLYSSSVLQLQPEDVLLFYSDGITESTSATREAFRTGGLLQAARNAEAGAEAVASAVWEAMLRHSAGTPHAPDDRTLLVVRLSGADRSGSQLLEKSSRR